MSKRKSDNFYDRVAKEYGAYDISSNNISKEYPKENPEYVFRRMLLKNSGDSKIALDLGCGDGKFTLSIARCFRRIFAIDISKMLLIIASKLQKEKRITNVIFKIQDAYHITYSNNFFDVVYSRRGPIPFQEIYRVLKLQGIFISIEIAELDCKELKTIFRRGQNYKEWEGPSRKEKNIRIFKNLGFKILFTKEYFYVEYYPNYKTLEAFLKRVPVFEDFNPRRDKEKLNEYVNRNTVNKGIRLPRHKLISIVQKL